MEPLVTSFLLGDKFWDAVTRDEFLRPFPPSVRDPEDHAYNAEHNAFAGALWREYCAHRKAVRAKVAEEVHEALAGLDAERAKVSADAHGRVQGLSIAEATARLRAEAEADEEEVRLLDKKSRELLKELAKFKDQLETLHIVMPS
jgi:hypothetical protein